MFVKKTFLSLMTCQLKRDTISFLDRELLDKTMSDYAKN